MSVDVFMRFVMIPIGVYMVWQSKDGARQLAVSKRIPRWMELPARVLYVVMGLAGIGAGIKLLVWP